MQGNILREAEQMREDIDAMKKHLFPSVDCQERCDTFARDAVLSVVCRNGQHVVAQVKPDRDEVLRQMKKSQDARRLARGRLCRETDEELDNENKENVYYSKNFFKSDSANRRRRRRDVLPSSAEFDTVTCCRDHKDSPRLSSQLDRFYVDVPRTGRSSRSDDSANTPLIRSADCDEVRRPRVLAVVTEERAATTDNDTSVWSAVSFDDNRHPPSATQRTAVDSDCVSPILEPELSRICSSSPAEQRELREQTSSGDLTGAFHSTFSYPLHSTLLSAAVNHVDVSSVLQTVAEADAARHDLEQTVSSSKSSLTQTVRDVGHRDCATHDTRNDDFLFDHVATSEADHVRTKSSRQNLKPMMSRFSCYSEAGKDGEAGGKTDGRMMYFPPLCTIVDASTSDASTSATAAAAADINVTLGQQDVDDAGAGGDWRTAHGDVDTDTSVEAVRGSPCDSSRDPTVTQTPSRRSDVDRQLTLSCKRYRLDATTSSRPVHGPNYHREGRCVSANATSKSGGREKTGLARETGSCDLRHTFNASRLVQDTRCEALTVRDLFRVYEPPDQGRAVDSRRHCRSTRLCRQCRPRPRCTHCRCGAQRINFDDLRTGRSSHDRRRSVLPPGESENKPRVKRPERYFDPVRKRTLVNRLKQFSGCFCDTGCGRRMRTLANV